MIHHTTPTIHTNLPVMRIAWGALLLFVASLPTAALATQAPGSLRVATPPTALETATWIAPHGSDATGNGTEQRPFYTPARAALLGRPILALPGRYTEFGTITQGGTARTPLVLRPATSGTVVFALQDAAQPATIAASHIELQDITIHGRELATPGTCLRIEGPREDLTLTRTRIDHCQVGLDAGTAGLTHLTLEDSSMSDIRGQAIDCGRTTCSHHRFTRVQFEHLGYDTTTTTAKIIYSATSRDSRWRDVVVRDSIGDGVRFDGPAASIANSQFIQIDGTALTLGRGGYITKTDIATLKTGLAAHIGDGLVIERSLLRNLSTTSTPFLILPNDHSSPTSSLVFAYSRIEVPGEALVLGASQSRHTVVWNGLVAWFSHPSPVLVLPGGQRVSVEESAQVDAITREDDSQLFFGEASTAELFSPRFSGGETTYNPDGSRTITAGSELRGETSGQSYILGQDDRVHFLVRESQREAWYPYGSVNILKEERLEDLIRGDDMTEPPGSLIKIPERPQVYVVTAPNIIRWVLNEALAYAFAGPRWAQRITTIPREEMTQYEEGDPITTEADFEASDVLRQVPDPGDLFQKE